MNISTGAQVGLSCGVRGEVEDIKTLPNNLTSYLIEGQWYSDPAFLYAVDSGKVILNFPKIPVTLPKFWLQMIGYVGHEIDFPYFAIFYSGSKATWYNGRGMQTFSYFGAYRPVIEHFAIAYHLLDANLGSDDSEATHALIFDSTKPDAIEMYVASWRDMMGFIKAVAPKPEPLPHLTQEDLDELALKYRQKLATDAKTMQQLGMFELFLGRSKEQMEFASRLIQYLDAYITQELVEQYLEAARNSHKAQYHLYQMERRIAAS